jgi:hypothetical protein
MVPDLEEAFGCADTPGTSKMEQIIQVNQTLYGPLVGLTLFW